MRGVLSGLIAAFALVAAAHFGRFGRKTGDAFYKLFAAAFVLFGVNSIALGVTAREASHRATLYIIRLVAFVIILIAIWQKSRK